MADAMTVIRQYLNEMEALVARSVLEAHDIPAVVLRDNAGGMLPAMHLLYPVRLAVPAHSAALALRLGAGKCEAGSTYCGFSGCQRKLFKENHATGQRYAEFKLQDSQRRIKGRLYFGQCQLSFADRRNILKQNCKFIAA